MENQIIDGIDFSEGTKSIEVDQAVEIYEKLHIAMRINDGKRVTFQFDGLRKEA